MFTWVDKKTVKSIQGFVVQFTGRGTAEYRENGRKMTVYHDLGFRAGNPCILLCDDAFKHWDNDSVPLSETEQKRVYENFRAACKFQDLEVG